MLSLATAAHAFEGEAKGKKGGGKKITPEALIDQLDADKDGMISKEEFTGRYKKPEKKQDAEKQFTAMDVDGDGKLTLAEVQAGCNRK